MAWSLFKEGDRWVIRQWEGEKYRRLPVSQYRRIRDDEDALRLFLDRLNAPSLAKAKVKFKHAFIDDVLLSDYLEWLMAQVPSQRNARNEFQYLKTYCLNYFIGKLDLMNPLDWHEVSETKWARYLLSDGCPGSAKAKREVVRSLNRFIGWLHRRRPGEVNPLKFTPISKAAYKQIEAERRLSGEMKTRQVVDAKDLGKIVRLAPKSILPFIRLSLNYGLRRGECCGVLPGDVRKELLRVERQLVALTPDTTFGPTKGRDPRSVPHWFSTPLDAYRDIEAAGKHRMHPDTLTDRWNDLMEEIELGYDFHDLRHTFITRAVNAYPHELVRLAAGHKDIKTTMGYIHDSRELDDEVFTPVS